MSYFNEQIADLRMITGMPEKDIIDFVQSNIISYRDLRVWYSATGSLPNKAECAIIHRFGIERIRPILAYGY